MPSIVHKFVSAKADGADATLVKPSDWNTTHTVLGYTYKGTRILTSVASATYTLPGSVAGLWIQMWGAGGGGAGCSSSALNAAVGGAGGAGGYGSLFIGSTSVTSAYDYKCGPAGTGGASGSNPGTAGGTTWFRGADGATWVAYGGAGGVAMTTAATAASTAAALGGSTSNASFGITGQSGGKGIRYSGTVMFCDLGGQAAFAPGAPGFGGPTAGATAAGYACGGGGAAIASTGNAKGGDGGPGLIWIDEYY